MRRITLSLVIVLLLVGSAPAQLERTPNSNRATANGDVVRLMTSSRMPTDGDSSQTLSQTHKYLLPV